jgi:hypothetical protein
MNCTKPKPSLQDQQINCYRIWMRPKVPHKKMDRRGHVMLGQYLLNLKK